MRKEIIRTEGVKKHYQMGNQTVRALDGIDLTIRKNEFVAIMGPSGSGKSTLMNILGCLDVPSEGTYSLNGQSISGMDDDDLASIRNREIGFDFSHSTSCRGTPHLKMWHCRWPMPGFHAKNGSEGRVRHWQQWGWKTEWSTSQTNFREAKDRGSHSQER